MATPARGSYPSPLPPKLCSTVNVWACSWTPKTIITRSTSAQAPRLPRKSHPTVHLRRCSEFVMRILHSSRGQSPVQAKMLCARAEESNLISHYGVTRSSQTVYPSVFTIVYLKPPPRFDRRRAISRESENLQEDSKCDLSIVTSITELFVTSAYSHRAALSLSRGPHKVAMKDAPTLRPPK